MSIIFNGHYRMKHRTWITEALRLHFEEHLPRVVAGRRLGVPKSTVCSMFVRFRRAGLSWPLPAGMSEQELDACLYGQFSTVPVVRPESTVISEAPVVKKRPRRPNFPYEFKIALVEQSLQPGACVAQIARENGINDNLLFNWRHQYRKGGLINTPSDSLCCDLVLPAGTLRLKGKLTPALLQTLIREIKGSRH
ncbi:IS66-like element accessory protein TnpA [Salmonella enterica]